MKLVAGSWSCWSEYSDCSVTCGSGIRHRQRQCIQLPGSSFCRGDRSQTITCSAGPCSQGTMQIPFYCKSFFIVIICYEDGYGEWSGWSSCNKLGVQVRIRPCLSLSFCKGVPDAQMSQCHHINDKSSAETILLHCLKQLCKFFTEFADNEVGAIYQASSANETSNSSILVLILGIGGAFLFGFALAFILCCYAVRRRSNCFYIFGVKKPSSSTNSSLFPVHPPTPTTAKSSNIYTPPPSLRNIHPAPNVTMNPLNSFTDHDYEGLSEQETTLTLKRTMRTSLNNRDYL